MELSHNKPKQAKTRYHNTTQQGTMQDNNIRQHKTTEEKTRRQHTRQDRKTTKKKARQGFTRRQHKTRQHLQFSLEISNLLSFVRILYKRKTITGKTRQDKTRLD